MRIGLAIDALSPQMSGIGRYVWELAQGLANHREIEDHRLFRFNRWYRSGTAFLSSAQPPRSAVPRWLRPLLMRRGFRGRLFHGPNYFVPEQAERSVVTVHDLSVLRFPEFHPQQRRRDFERHFERSLGQANHIISDSEFVRNELHECMGIAKERVTAVPLGVDEGFFRRGEPTAVPRPRSGIAGGRYALCVATFEPRKGLHLAAQAFVEARQRDPTLPCDRLIIAGAAGWENAELRSCIQPWIDRGLVVLAGYLPEQELIELYTNASLFLYPSAYEGFGLPPLEAMATGTPVVMSSHASLREVAGPAATVNPADIDAFAETIAHALLNTEWRDATISAGIRHASGFTWRACVERTVDVYRSVWSTPC